MNFTCDRCERSFKWKACLVRHKRRKTPCRKPMYSCTDCSKLFVSHQSLNKHKVLYCRKKMSNQTPLSDILAGLFDQDGMSNNNNKPLDEFLDLFNEKPLKASSGETQELPEVKLPGTANYFDEVLSSWIDQLLMLEGKFHGGMASYGEAFKIIDRLLQDGLISVFEHSDLYYTTRLFIRLHNIYQMGMITRLKDEYVDILITLFEIKKISRDALQYLLINL